MSLTTWLEAGFSSTQTFLGRAADSTKEADEDSLRSDVSVLYQ